MATIISHWLKVQSWWFKNYVISIPSGYQTVWNFGSRSDNLGPNCLNTSDLIVKYNIGLKTLLQQGISEPIFYGDLVYKFKRIVGKPNFSDQFKKIVKCYIRVGYNLDIMRQSACLVLNPIMVNSYGFLFNCMTVGQASDSMTALT